MKVKLSQLGKLFCTFAVVGVTTFGGGYAMLPALQREVVEKRRWATDEEVMDWYAIGQCTDARGGDHRGRQQQGCTSLETLFHFILPSKRKCLRTLNKCRGEFIFM